MAQLQISLSRAHKVAERIKTRMGELFAEAQSRASVQTLTGVTDLQVSKLQSAGREALELNARAEKFALALAKLRAAIGAENHVRGINAMLAELDALNRIVANKKAMLVHAKADGIAPQDLATYKPLVENRSYSLGVTVTVLDAESAQGLAESLAAAQRDVFSLSDRIAEANAARFTFELDDDVASEVTGA